MSKQGIRVPGILPARLLGDIIGLDAPPSLIQKAFNVHTVAAQSGGLPDDGRCPELVDFFVPSHSQIVGARASGAFQLRANVPCTLTANGPLGFIGFQPEVCIILSFDAFRSMVAFLKHVERQ